MVSICGYVLYISLGYINLISDKSYPDFVEDILPHGFGTNLPFKRGSQMAERLGNRAINQKVAGLIPIRAK